MRHLTTRKSILVVMLVVLLCGADSPGQGRMGQRPGIKKSDYFDRELTAAQKQILYPSAEDQTRFATLLALPNTGIFRLLPGGKYEFTSTVSADASAETVLPIKGGGAYYSFARKTHKYGPWSEISLQNGRLLAGFDTGTLGLMTSLGDVPLESVTVENPAVDFLAQIKPPNRYFDIQEQRSRNHLGVRSSGMTYKSDFEAVVGRTYVVRSTNYRREGFLHGIFKVYIPHPSDYEGSDSLVALRVVRQDKDGSLVIIWKRLKRFKAPKLVEAGLEEYKIFFEKELPLGSESARILNFLNLNGISHTVISGEQGETSDYSNKKVSSVIRALIPGMERNSFAIYDLSIDFLLDREGRLVGHRFTKIKKFTRRFP